MIPDNFRIPLDERTNVEFKTSLFFRAGISQVSEDQICVIMRTLAGFMNAEGGTLYIGVNDNGVVRSSVTEEYQYMNLFPPFNNYTYSPKEDGYRRFITDWASAKLGNFAAALINVDFENFGAVKICKITAKKSYAPIWFDRTELYIRADGSTKRLTGDLITSYYLQIKGEDLLKKMNDVAASANRMIIDIKQNKTQPKNSILVVYPNGDFIHEKNNVNTMIEVILRAGINNVMNLGITGRKGKGKTPYVPFIATQPYFDNPEQNGKTQRAVGDYYIFIKYSKGDIMSKIQQISNGLGLQLHIEDY